jgi:hypothetical protein
VTLLVALRALVTAAAFAAAPAGAAAQTSDSGTAQRVSADDVGCAWPLTEVSEVLVFCDPPRPAKP